MHIHKYRKTGAQGNYLRHICNKEIIGIIDVSVCALSCVWFFATPWTIARLLCLWAFPGKNSGAGCHFLLQGIFMTQGSKPCLPCLLHCRWILYHCATRKTPLVFIMLGLISFVTATRNMWLVLCCSQLNKLVVNTESRILNLNQDFLWDKKKKSIMGTILPFPFFSKSNVNTTCTQQRYLRSNLGDFSGGPNS